jgi:PHP family Zn ribbon phosphoesterase
MKRCAATVMDVLSSPVHSLKCIASLIVHHAPFTQMVKQIVQHFRKRYTEDVTVVQQLTRVTDLSICIKHIINLV